MNKYVDISITVSFRNYEKLAKIETPEGIWGWLKGREGFVLHSTKLTQTMKNNKKIQLYKNSAKNSLLKMKIIK